jgi:hypothetical protein
VFVLSGGLDPTKILCIRATDAHPSGAEPTIAMTVPLAYPVSQPAFGSAQVDVRTPVTLVEGRGKDEAVAEISEAIL